LSFQPEGLTVSKHNAKNTRIKREYFQYLREARGYGAASVDAVAKAISRFEESAKHRDFAGFHREQAVAFKRKLGEQLSERSGKPLSRSTIAGTLRALREFFIWLAGQPGYKAKIHYADADYFNQSDKEQAVARATRPKSPPTLDQMQHVLATMPERTPIERRNRAVVALVMLTGARDGALASLRLKHLDLAEGVLRQDGREVRTKFAKTFSTWFFPIGGEALSIVSEWVELLRRQHWGDEDPLFPATQVGTGENGGFVAKGLSRHGWSTAAPIRSIFREACAEAQMPYFHPHSLRDMLAQLGERMCKTAEEFKVWSQNLGHNSVLTTLISYGTVPPHRQAEIMRRFGAHRDTRDPLDDPEVRDVLRRIARLAA
jgi:integrase